MASSGRRSWRARVLLLRSRHTVRDATEIAKRLELRVIDMPSDHERLVAVIRGELPESREGDSSAARPL